MSHFSTPEVYSLEKTVSVPNSVARTELENVDCVYEISHCVEWIKSNGFRNVCLQFPDHLLHDAAEVARRIRSGTNQSVFIMGDTTYESCCIDYITAAHVQADAVIQFGPVCFSQQIRTIPHLTIYEKLSLDIHALYNHLSLLEKKHDQDELYLLLDTGYYHLQDKLLTELKTLKVKIIQISDKMYLSENCIVLFVGDERKLPNVKFIFKPKNLYHLPISPLTELVLYENINNILKRRYYLLEKIKDSRTIGIIIGTLAVSNYLKVIERLRKLFNLYKKKYYLIYVGKPSVTKLANFPESDLAEKISFVTCPQNRAVSETVDSACASSANIDLVDIYVLVTCSMSQLYQSRDFYAPIATPYDVEIALNENAKHLDYSLDFNSYISQVDPDIHKIDISKSTDVSLLTGKVRCLDNEEDASEGEQSLSLKNPGTVAQNSCFGVGYLNKRSWVGLEQNLGQTPVTKAEEGRSGIAQSYENEIS